MRRAIVTAVLFLIPSLCAAQAPARGYISGAGGFASTADGSSGDVLGEGGVRVLPNLYIVGNVGKFHNLAPSLFQPGADAVSADFGATGLSLTDAAAAPAWYTTGGVRYEIPVGSRRFTPYATASAGVAHVMPSDRFTYSNGTLLGSTPSPGDDVTSQLISLGEFTQPAATNAFMFSTGGGVDVPVAPHLAVDVGYRVSRIATDTPVTAQSVTFGIGYRF
jgi:opacity protein-like surface antigen